MLIGGLIAVFVFLFVPHPNALTKELEQTEDLVKKNVKDETTQKAALKILDQAEDAAKKSGPDKKQMDALTAVLNKRTSTPAEIQAALQPLDAAGVAAAKEQLDWRFQLKTVLGEAEWAKVFPLPAAKTDSQAK
jgi:hypothetical protein